MIRIPDIFCHAWLCGWDRVLLTFPTHPQLSSNHSPPNLCLQNSWDYRCEPLHPALHVYLYFNLSSLLYQYFLMTQK
jgi:hypothetical protein